MDKGDLTPGQVENLFRHGRLDRSQFIRGLAALGISIPTLQLWFGSEGATSAAAQVSIPSFVVLITIDAFRPDYAHLADMPVLRSLMARGVTYERAWVGQMESETPASHATLCTGCMPKHDGIIGFEWADPATHKEVLDGWPPEVLAGKMEADMRASGADSIAAGMKRLAPSALAVSVSSEKVYAAEGMGGPAADYILYHTATGPGHQTYKPAAVPGHAPPASFMKSLGPTEHLPLKHFTDWDWMSTELALQAFHAYQPGLLMVNLPSADVYGHPFGGPADPGIFRQIVTGVDRNIARIVAAYQAAGIFDQTLFVIAGDHGMVPNTRTVPGASTQEAVQKAGGQYVFHTGGTAADIYLANPSAAAAVAAGQLEVPNVAAAYYKVHHGSNRYEYAPAKGQKIDASLDAAYRYFLDTFVGPTAPDVVAAFRENTVGRSFTYAYGAHGGMNWGAQSVPLILSGPGVPSGVTSAFPARLMDVAPTVLRLLGIAPLSMDGIVLADAVAGASASEVAEQSSLNPLLTSYQDALILQSLDNVEEDQTAGRRPPPTARPKP